MRRSIALTLFALAAGCGEPAPDDAAHDVIRTDSVDAVPAPADDAVPAAEEPATEDGASGAGDADTPAAATIPASFRGEWNADRSACGTGASETRLRIGAREIRFYESTGVVRAVNVVSDRVVEVSAEYTGEGATWRDERRLTLAPDGGSLTVSGGGDLVRYRCP